LADVTANIIDDEFLLHDDALKEAEVEPVDLLRPP
jgi:hypothetical protein